MQVELLGIQLRSIRRQISCSPLRLACPSQFYSSQTRWQRLFPRKLVCPFLCDTNSSLFVVLPVLRDVVLRTGRYTLAYLASGSLIQEHLRQEDHRDSGHRAMLGSRVELFGFAARVTTCSSRYPGRFFRACLINTRVSFSGHPCGKCESND